MPDRLLAQRKGQLAVRDATTQCFGRAAKGFDGNENVFHQFVDIVGATVCQFPFGQRPDSFIGVELWIIGRKVLNAKAAMLAQKFFDPSASIAAPLAVVACSFCGCCNTLSSPCQLGPDRTLSRFDCKTQPVGDTVLRQLPHW